MKGNVIGKIANKMPAKKIYEKSSGNSQKNYPMYSERVLQVTASQDARHRNNIFSKTLNNFKKNYPMYSEGAKEN